MSDEPPIIKGDSLPAGGPFGRFSARPEGSPYPKAELLPRLLARLTDFILAAMLPVVTGEVGVILAVLYVLFADGVLRGQSLGKRLLGIKVVCLNTRRESDYRASALRNFPFALVLLLQLLPPLAGLPFATLALILFGFEGWRVFADKLGLRMGDLIAGTQVVDTKVLASPRSTLAGAEPEGSQLRGAARLVLLEPPSDTRRPG